VRNVPIETLRDLWERNARLQPDMTCLVYEKSRMTYSELMSRSVRLSNALASGGVKPGDRVSILAMNCIEYVEVLAANHILGSIAATLNFRLAGPELEWILGDAAPSALIFENQYAELVDSLRPRLSGIDRYIVLGGALEWAESYEEVLASGAEDPPLARPAPEDIAHLIYTSGTTGRPKGVMRSHRSEVYQGDSMATALDMRPGSRILEVMPYFHLGAQSSTWGLLWRAGTIYIHRSFEVRGVLETVAAERITHLHLVPIMIQDLLDVEDLEEFDLSSVETILYSAAPITPAVLRRGMEKMGRTFLGMWGMTEGAGTLLAKESHLPDGTAEEVALLSSVGQQTQWADIRIVDETGNDCAPGEAGELWLKGHSLLSGYWNNSVATIDAMEDGWFKTGDMGYLGPADNIFLVDRKKDMIISGGENIYSQEVERAMAEHPDVDRVSVIGLPDERWGEVVVGIVVLRSNATPDADALIEHCATQIASYKKPKRIEFVDDFPALPSGKINKVALREQFSDAKA
jgi:acyl-CoA synthetase (AMP-forming)/AMP-acid ligase II